MKGRNTEVDNSKSLGYIIKEKDLQGNMIERPKQESMSSIQKNNDAHFFTERRSTKTTNNFTVLNDFKKGIIEEDKNENSQNESKLEQNTHDQNNYNVI